MTPYSMLLLYCNMGNPTRRSASRCVNLRWNPKGECKDLVETSVAFVPAAAPPPIKEKKRSPFQYYKRNPFKNRADNFKHKPVIKTSFT